MRYLLSFALLCSSLISLGQETTVKSKISEVLVYLKGAQVTRTARVNVEAGVSSIKLDQLSQDIDPNSIQVNGGKLLTILSVKHQTNFLEAPDSKSKLSVLKEKSEKLAYEIDAKKRAVGVYQQEEGLLNANLAIKSDEGNLDIEDLKEMAIYYRTRSTDIKLKMQTLSREQKALEKERQKIDNELRQLAAIQGKNTGEITISVSSRTKQSGKLSVSYLVRSAGWIPEYDVRSSGINNPIELTYKGRVYQSTGYDWEKVKIKLSTGNPTRRGTQPTVFPWTLDFAPTYDSYGYDGLVYDKGRKDEEKAVYSYDEKRAKSKKAVTYKSSTADYTKVEQASVNTVFNVNIPYTIPSDGARYTVEVQKHDIQSTYAYFTVPKLDNDAFLLANVVGWDNYNLIPGQASIYFEGTYVGRSFLNPSTTSDTLSVSLGRDPNIKIERTKVKDFSKASTVGSNKKLETGYEIKVHNARGKTILLNVEDQIPVSVQKDIVVSLDKDGGASLDETTGKLSWLFILGPGETKTVQFKYTVKYPKDQNIGNL